MLKKYFSRFMLPAVALAFCTQANAAPQYPYPQQIKYKYGNTATFVEPSVIQKHFNNWKSAWYKDMNNGTARVISPNDSTEMSVSEGIAYGMMIMVYMSSAAQDYQTEFDKLWAYWKKYAVQGGSPSGMNWHVNNNNGSVASGSASDADIDAAFALIMASKQWNNPTYLTEAKSLISWMKTNDMESDGRVKAGSNWNPALNPSYVIPAAFKLFADVTGDAFWEKAVTVNIEHVQKCQHATSGLMPDWCDWNAHTPSSNTGAAVSGGKGGFFDDAARTPWRMAMAYNWYGIEGAKAVNDKIVPWLDKYTYGDANMIWPGYALDGMSCPYSFFTTSTYVGGLGLAMGSADNPKNYLESVYTVLANSEGAEQAGSYKGEKYYPATLNILTMLSMSGNMPNLNDMATATKYTQTPLKTPQEPAGTLMPVNSGAAVWGYENWGVYADKFGVTTMAPDSGSTGIYLGADGKYFISAQMRIAPEPTYEAGVDLIYPFAGLALSFDKQDNYYDLSKLATIKLTYASEGVIRMAILDKQTQLDGNEGGEPGFYLHPSEDFTTVSIGVTESDFGSSYEDYLKDKIVAPSWVGPGNDRNTVMQAVRGLKFEAKMSKGGFGSIKIASLELIDANGQLITEVTNGDFSNIKAKPANGPSFVKVQGKNIVYNNVGKATFTLFDVNGNKVFQKNIENSGVIALQNLNVAKGNYIATVKGNNIKQITRIQK